MSDDRLRAAERALASSPFDRTLRLSYGREWERAGFPIFGRDPIADPRPGDVVGPACRDRNHPDSPRVLGTILELSGWEVYRCVVGVERHEDGRVWQVEWTPKIAGYWPPEPWTTGEPWRKTYSTMRAEGKRTRYGATNVHVARPARKCSIDAWRRAPTRNSFPGDVVLWIEPDVWLPAEQSKGSA